MKRYKSLIKTMYVTISVVIGSVLASACTPDNISSSTALAKEFDRSNKPIVLIVNTYPSERAVTEAYKDFLGKDLRKDPNKDATRQGWATWKKDGTCSVHIVAPRKEDDSRTLTLGHEVAHCLYGRYHK